MKILRSERTAAALLLGAAILGLIIANTTIGPTLIQVQHDSIGSDFFHISIGHLISDGLLAIFFFIVAVELKHELIAGELNSVQKAAHPAIAALGGVAVPAGIYLLIAGRSGYADGWPIPTATDIAFALGVLAIFGRGLPGRIRIFMLALAVLDDLIAILIIAFFFTANPNLLDLALAAASIVAFAVLSRLSIRRLRVLVGTVMVLLAILTWLLVYDSGVHATIAGVALGLAMARKPGRQVRHVLEPWSNGVILPIFAFSAALVPIPQVSPSQLAAPFWAILIALPVGKLLGITLGGWVGSFVVRSSKPHVDFRSLIVIAGLGGIGFTVSLLMNELAFASKPLVRDEGTLAVLLGSGVSIVIAALLVSWRARGYRRPDPVKPA